MIGEKNLWLFTLVFVIASFIPNLVILTFYFSSIIIEGSSGKYTLHKQGFVISLLGASAGSLFSLLIPLLPESIPWMDVSIGLAFVIWLSLTKHYTQMGWLESFAAALLGALLYIVILAIVTGFMMIFASIL